MKPLIRRKLLAPFAAASKPFGPRSRRAWTRRARLMMRHTWLLTIGAALLVAGLAALTFHFASRPTTLTFAVPGGNPEDVRLVQALGQQLSRERAAIRLKPVPVETPQQSAAAIDTGQTDLAVVRGDLPMPKNGLAVAILRENVAALIVPAAGSPAKARPGTGAKPAAGTKPAKSAAANPKKIETVEDLAGARIGVIGRAGGGTNLDVLNAILRQYEIAPDKVKIVPINLDDIGAALRKDPVDVIFALGPVSSRFTAEAIAAASTAKEQPTFLAIGASEAIARRLPAFESTEIKQGSFGGKKPLPDEAVETIAFRHFIVAGRGVSEGKVAEFTRLLFTVRQTLKQEYPAIAQIEKPDTDKDAAVQAHPGAAAYLDNDQKTFFERYSDWLYWGMVLMGFAGSAITWMTSYAKADDRVRRMRVIEHLIEVVKQARTADSVDQLEKLRADVDAVLKKTLQQVEYNNLDESALMAFSLALDQAQLAINDRRAVLASPSPRHPHGTAATDDTPPRSAGEPASVESRPLRMA